VALLDELKRMADEKRFKGLHPLVKRGFPLSVRDAYFRGLVLASLVDDGRIDDEERTLLRRIRLGINLDEEEGSGVISEFSELASDESKMLAAVTDTVSTLCDPFVARLFFAEFTQIWLSHVSNAPKLDEWRLALLGVMGNPIPSEWLKDLDVALGSQDPEQIAMLEEFEDDAVDFLFGHEVAGCVAVLKRSSAAEQDVEAGDQSGFKRLLIERFEGLDTFSRDDLFSDFQAKGGVQHFVGTLLGVVIPYMKSLLPMIVREIPLLIDNGGQPRKVMLCQSVSVSRFCRAFDAAMMCIDVCNAKKPAHYRASTKVEGEVDRECSYLGKRKWSVQIDMKQWDLDDNKSVMDKLIKEMDNACMALYDDAVQKIESYAKYF